MEQSKEKIRIAILREVHGFMQTQSLSTFEEKELFSDLKEVVFGTIEVTDKFFNDTMKEFDCWCAESKGVIAITPTMKMCIDEGIDF